MRLETTSVAGAYEASLTGGAANTKGSYTELFAATAFDAGAISLQFATATANRRFLADLSIGAASSEQVVVPNLMLCSDASSRVRTEVLIPCRVPSGARLAARVQDQTGSGVLGIAVTLMTTPQSAPAYARFESAGADTSTTRGAAIDPGGSANTLGAWTELIAATSFAYDSLIVFISGKANTGPAGASFMFQLGIGAGGSEQVVIPGGTFASEATSDAFGPVVFPFPGLAIPSGTRLAGRGASSTTDATDRLFEMTVLGMARAA